MISLSVTFEARDEKGRRHIYLPPEVWRQVLVRLPPKSLLRFRCVSKDWCSLIDNFDFLSLHLNLYRNDRAKTQLLVEHKVEYSLCDYYYSIRASDTFERIDKDVINLPYRTVFEGRMIHGLMLMYARNPKRKVKLCLWNPSIRKSLILPSCPLKCNLPYLRSFLGFAHSSSDYKVVVFDRVDGAAFEMAIAIFSLRDHQWIVKHHRMEVPKCIFETAHYGRWALVFQGALYWTPSNYMWSNKDTELFYFDFDAEELCSLQLPDIEDDDMFRFLFIFGGSLAFFCISKLRSCIWIMEKINGNELWRQCWTADTNVNVYKFIEFCLVIEHHLLYIEDTATLLVWCGGRLLAYNIRSNQACYLGKSLLLYQVEIYVESLVLHKGFKGAASIPGTTVQIG